MFDVHDTVRLHNINITPPRYVLDTLALGPKNAVLDQFNSFNLLAELDMLLKQCERNKIGRETVCDINIMVMKYVKACSKQKVPRHLKFTQQYLKENNLLAVPFDKGTGFCLMDANEHERKLMDILNLPQFEKVIARRKNTKDIIVKEEERVTGVLSELKDK